MNTIKLCVWPRITVSWEEFLKKAGPCSIALDGVVSGGPQYNEHLKCVNFDHHSCVSREATMSTAKQAFFAVKGGLFNIFKGRSLPTVYVNDSDQDTSLAVFILDHYKMFEGTASIPVFNRLLDLTDKLDITGGAFPMNLNDKLVHQHNWIFDPYSQIRKSGALAVATEHQISDNIEHICLRIHKFLMGSADEIELDTRHEILYDHSDFKVINEIGGNEARYHLFSKGMDAFVSLVAVRPDGRRVYSIGRRSRYIDFPVPELYYLLNIAEELEPEAKNGWGGSSIIGGSPRELGSKLSPEQVGNIISEYLKGKVTAER